MSGVGYHRARALVICLAVVLGAQALGWLLTGLSVADWYPTIAKPVWTPPGWAFGAVWTSLFLMMGAAVWLVWCWRGRSSVRLQLGLFGIQLALNVAWSGLFFGLRSPKAALVEIVLLWLAIAATLIAFGRVSRVAAWLLAPYWVWVSFAAWLNLAIVKMNP